MKSKLFKKLIAGAATLAMVAQFGFVLPASAADPIYSQDYESVADTAALKNIWSSKNYADGITLETDKTNYAQYTVGNQNTRSATSSFSVDLTDKTRYAVEFDLALTKSTKEDVQFAIASGTIPTNNTGIISDYIFKINMAGTTNNCTINDIDAATVTLTDSAWYHYNILVDTETGLETVTITDENGTAVFDKRVVPTNGINNKITGALFLSGRYSSMMKLDNIVVRDTTADDVFGEMTEETLSKIEFTSALGEIINQPAEDTPVHKPITVKATGIYGRDLTDKVSIKWSTTGLEGEDGYISLTAAEGTGAGTEGAAPATTDATAYFNVRNGVSNWFGNVTATVTYLEKELTISTPFAVIGASGSGTNIAPAAGYPESMNDYKDGLVGYKGTAAGIADQDLVLNNWSIYGSNGARSLTLNQDTDKTKYLQFASNNGSGSTVAVYQLPEQTSQYIVDMKVRFSGGDMAFGHYANTPNNGDSNSNWTASYSSGALTVGTQSITGLNKTDWFRVIASADESVGTYWVKVYDNSGTLVGKVDSEPLNAANAKKMDGKTAVDITPAIASWKQSQKYFCFMGSFPVDLASFKIYYPTVASMAVNTVAETISVPTAVEDKDVSLDANGVIKYNPVTKNATITVADVTEGSLIVAEYNKNNTLANVTTKPLTFENGVATLSNVTLPDKCKLLVWDSLEGVKPLSVDVGEYENSSSEVTADLTAVIADTDGFEVTSAVDWSIDVEDESVVLEETGTQNAQLTVLPGAPAGPVTVTARSGSAYAEKTINLTTTGNSIAFTKSTTSMTIPFSGEDAVSAEFAAQTVDKDGNKTDFAVDDDGNATATPAAVTLSVLDKNLNDITESLPTGVTFDKTTGTLTVSDQAKSNIIYIKATNNDLTPLSRTVKVNIHGLSFAFGSSYEGDDTQVTNDAYSDKTGYGFADPTVVKANADNVTGSADYRFKAKVPNGNYVVNVTTTSAAITSEVVESVPATTGISKSGTSFKVAVCDGVLDLTFASGSTLSELTITQDTAKTELDKPAVYAIGDSTTNNNANGAKSWGNCVGGSVTVPDVFSSFSNNGMAGRDSVSFYNQGRVETVLLNVCPGDYVTVNMGINSKETGEGAAYETLLSEYYIDAIIQRGAIPVIVTATPDGPTFDDAGNANWGTNCNTSTGVFTNNRGTGARNGVLRKLAQEKNLNIIELGYYFENEFNKLTMDDVNAYNTENGTSYTSVPDLVASWYVDHNHYKEPLGIKIGNYILDCVSKIADGSDAFNQANDPHITEQ